MQIEIGTKLLVALIVWSIAYMVAKAGDADAE